MEEIKVANRYTRPPEQVNRSCSSLNRYLRHSVEWRRNKKEKLVIMVIMVRMINIFFLRCRTNDCVVNIIFCRSRWMDMIILVGSFIRESSLVVPIVDGWCQRCELGGEAADSLSMINWCNISDFLIVI